MRPTLQTVADAVGVSRSTVSNAYSRPDQLSPELRARILATAKELGYAGPDATARSLRRGRAGAVGVLFTTTLSYAFVDPFAVLFLRGLAEAVERNGTGLLLVPLSTEDEAASVAAVQNAVVDGFCVYCVPEWHGSLEALRSRGLPVVTTEYRDDVPAGELQVGVDERAATRSAARHLIGLGHRRIALLTNDMAPKGETGPLDLSGPGDFRYFVERERVSGVAEAFAEAGVGWRDLIVVNAAANSRATGARAAAYALDRADRPTAIVACTDLLALGAMDALAARGLTPGRDVSVTGFDDIPEAAPAGLTTVRQPAVSKGTLAGELLLDPPEDPAERRLLLPTELIVRASTGPATTRR
ncbi:MAG TPA: LacI family DNA-binding transcriptional regulator [Phytomonospora sp.]